MHFKKKKKLAEPFETLVIIVMAIAMLMGALAVFEAGNTSARMDELEQTVANMETNTTSPHAQISAASLEKINTRLDEMDDKYFDISAEVGAVELVMESIELFSTAYTAPYYDTGIFAPSGLSADQFNDLMSSLSLYYEHEPENFIIHGMGSILVKIEETYRINGLYIIAICHRESGMKTSDYAISTNNPTSVSLSNGDLIDYTSTEECLMDTARLLREVYHDRWGKEDVWEVGDSYNPVNSTWAPKVHGTVEILIDMLNKN